MNGLYKGRYIIAIYDKDDVLIDVASYPRELNSYKSRKVANSYICKVFKGVRKGANIHFIDCLEKHDDIFAEEDEEFLKYFEIQQHNSNRRN